MQLALTVYVPETVSCTIQPPILVTDRPERFPCPSKVYTVIPAPGSQVKPYSGKFMRWRRDWKLGVVTT
jgi:hypothetical protein